MKREALPILAARGFVSAFTAWKALLFLLLVNAALALAFAGPVRAALHDALDSNPMADRLLGAVDATFFTHFRRAHPDVLGDVEPLEKLAAGEAPEKNPLALSGAAGSLVLFGLLSALAASVAAGGFAGRFGAERERGSLSAFGTDCGRFAFSSLVLGAVALAGIVGAYLLLFAAPGRLYAASELRYEWEATGLVLFRLVAFLVAAGSVRLAVAFARAAMGISRNGNPFLALASGAGFVLGRPGRALVLEVLFGAAALVPLGLWGAWAPVWDGADPARFALLAALQQLLVFWRIACRAAHLGAASAWMRRTAEAARPAPEKLETKGPLVAGV